MHGRQTLLALGLALAAGALHYQEGVAREMDKEPITTETTPTKQIREGDSWAYSVRGFLAGGFRVVPLSGELIYTATREASSAPDGQKVLALSYGLHLTSGGRPFTDQGAVYFHQRQDRSLAEYGTVADGWIEQGPVQYLPGVMSTGYRAERRFSYGNGAAEEGAISVTAARILGTPLGEYQAFKVEDRYRRTEPSGAFTRVNDTGWFVPSLGFFTRGTVTVRAYDPRGRFQHFQLHGFQLEHTSLTP